MPSENVNEVMKVIKKKPQLVVAMNALLAVACKEAGVTLNLDEKEEAYKTIGYLVKTKGVTG
jgi:hypothetical protein